MDESSLTALTCEAALAGRRADVKGNGTRANRLWRLRPLIQGIVGVAIAVAFIWLIYKLGKLADAYIRKIKGKN